MATILLGLGMVLTMEGLVLALAPSRIEDILEFIRSLPLETRRALGLAAMAFGVLLIWLAETFAG
ncbi:DUF2065 domain-containing protein [Ostreiculturibacter nitratireducens]|uniref:DUF2065 domain-containing protein n=1 Tax=Ostreiculturibacter nitratireducens TaxID=3075226 RepID=UPI0031B5A08A